MLIDVREIAVKGNSTLSSLFIDGVWECFVLEDVPRQKKIWGETRIAGGRYKLVPRYAGKHFERYKERFGHEFSLYIPDVPDFQWIMIHIGNRHVETHGCLLVGKGAESSTGSFELKNSRLAYIALYEKIKAVIYKEEIHIEIIRIDDEFI